MKKAIQLFAFLLFVSFIAFSCTKENLQQNEATAAAQTTDVVDLGVLDRNETYYMTWNSSDGINIQYQVINTQNNQVLFTKYWTSFVSGNHTFSAPDDIPVKVILKATRNYLGKGLTNMNWTWQRSHCPSTLTGTYGVTAPINTPWANIAPYYIANPSNPCQ